jgi:uncharacterized membrane protein
MSASILLFVHISAGGIGLLSGAAALLLRKGSRLHRQAGIVFVASMLSMAILGSGMAAFLPVPERVSVLAGVMTVYLLVTGWSAVRRPAGSFGLFDVGVLLASLAICGAAALLMTMASNSPGGTLDGQPREAFFLFIIIGAIAVLGDLQLVLRRGTAGAARIARHLWRMCAALFIAAGSFFLGQQQVFPVPLQGSMWLNLPVIAVLALMLFWLVRVRFSALWQRKRLHAGERA